LIAGGLVEEWSWMVSLMQGVPRRGWATAIERAKRHTGAAPAAFRARPFLLALILVSTVMNLLMLLTVVSVLKAFHWATQNHSVNVFAGLLVIVVLGYVFYAILQLARMRILRRFADAFDQAYERAAFRATAETTSARFFEADSHVRDLGRIRGFILDRALSGLLDLPWAAVFVGVLTFLHPLLGLFSTLCTLLVAILTVLARRLAGRLPDGNERAEPYLRAISIRDGNERAFGVAAQFEDKWIDARSKGRRARRNAQWLPDLLQAFAGAGRRLNTVAILATAVYLTTRSANSFGIIVSCGILVRRISMPVDDVVRSWPDIKDARKAWPRLQRCLSAFGATSERRAAVRAAGPLVVEGVCGSPPGRDEPSLVPVSFVLQPGESLGVVGPSGAGKSMLANILAGRWRATSGKMLLGDLDCFGLPAETTANSIGFVPQRARFFEGTIGENICRFAANPDEQRLREVIRLARLREFIARLPFGLDTQLAFNGHVLPAGIVQKLALARAAYQKPSLLILDDPTAHLDRDGELALLNILKAHREEEGIVVLAASQSPLLLSCEWILVLRGKQPPLLRSNDDFLKSDDVRLIGAAVTTKAQE
jgi:ABC-type protease/lipase transport system fused ATPase/permease subunit